MVYRYSVEWSIPNAGPSVSVFHFGDSDPGGLQAGVNALRAAFAGIASLIPDEVVISFPPAATELDTATGQTLGFPTVTPPANVSGSSSGGWAGGTGIRLVWPTEVVYNGRRVRGSTFLVPMASSSFTSGGLVSPAATTTVQTAFDTFRVASQLTNTPFGIWHRPTTQQGGGFWAAAAATTVSPRAGTLRGRKY